MAHSQFTILITFLLLLQLVFSSVTATEYEPTKPMEKRTEVVVEGMVYCQSCEHFGTWSLSGAEPLPSAKASVICKNHKDQVSYYKVFETNNRGYFYGLLEGFKISHTILDHPLHSCHVKLVSSLHENCSLLSNVNYGLYGAPLRYENKRIMGKSYEKVIYSAGPLAFRPAHCTPTNPN